MAFTEQDLQNLRKAYTTGATRVRYADGREVTFRSLAEMKQIIDEIAGELTGTPAPLLNKTYAQHSRD